MQVLQLFMIPTFTSVKSLMYIVVAIAEADSLNPEQLRSHLGKHPLWREIFCYETKAVMIVLSSLPRMRISVLSVNLRPSTLTELFRSVPGAIFTQLFTINGFVRGQQFSLVYALLPSKSRNLSTMIVNAYIVMLMAKPSSLFNNCQSGNVTRNWSYTGVPFVLVHGIVIRIKFD